MLPDVNHPRALLPRWQEEAARLRERALSQACPDAARIVLMTRAACLEQCAEELAGRLLWSTPETAAP